MVIDTELTSLLESSRSGLYALRQDVQFFYVVGRFYEFSEFAHKTDR